MVDVINLRQFKKTKLKAEKTKKASENRFSFGQKKLEKAIHKAKIHQENTFLDQHFLSDKDA
jgi:hypothetical protein